MPSILCKEVFSTGAEIVQVQVVEHLCLWCQGREKQHLWQSSPKWSKRNEQTHHLSGIVTVFRMQYSSITLTMNNVELMWNYDMSYYRICMYLYIVGCNSTTTKKLLGKCETSNLCCKIIFSMSTSLQELLLVPGSRQCHESEANTGNTKVENTGFVWPYPKLTLYQLMLITLPTTFGVVLAKNNLRFRLFSPCWWKSAMPGHVLVGPFLDWNFLTTPCCWKDLNNKCLRISLKNTQDNLQ